ncbi:uncharacterized protein [Antedon mediterranea]|uniref:uncharacterized protein n=1 Tax=Antedon mediterranea TaxID=105859 RepID=UPI003AF834EC
MLGAIEYYILACRPEEPTDYGVDVCLVAVHNTSIEVQWIFESSDKHPCNFIISNLDTNSTDQYPLPKSINTFTKNDLVANAQYQISLDCCPWSVNRSECNSMRSNILEFRQGSSSSDEIVCTNGYTHFIVESDFIYLQLCAVVNVDHFTLIEWQIFIKNVNCTITHQYYDGKEQENPVNGSGYFMVPFKELTLSVYLECRSKTNHTFVSILRVYPDITTDVCSGMVVDSQNVTTRNRIDDVEIDEPAKNGLNEVAAAIFMATAFLVLVFLLILIGYKQYRYMHIRRARRADRPLLAQMQADDEDEEGTSRMAEITL